MAVLQQNDILPLPQYKILHDLDFKKLESSIVISQKQKMSVFAQLEKDLIFLDSIKAVNYSMLLYKIDRTEESLNKSLEEEYKKTHVVEPHLNIK